MTESGVGGAAPSSFRRSAGTPKGQARRADLLDRVARDLAENGLVDFSLRRAAKAAGATHKVLLYYFADVDDLLAQAMLQLRRERIGNALAAVAERPPPAGLADRILAVWPVLEQDASGLRVVDQAIGLAMYDPERFAHLANEAAEQYLPVLRSLLPEQWSARRRAEVADLLLAMFRGFLMDWRTTGDDSRIRSASMALRRWLEGEERLAE